MEITYDPNKSQRNIEQRGLSFDLVADLEWDTALIVPDTRFDYPEARFTATGFIEQRLHVVCFTPTSRGIRVISFRKANRREVNNYESERTANQ